jgi:hypothetical protein
MITWSYWTLGGGMGYTLWTWLYQRAGAGKTYVCAAGLLTLNIFVVRACMGWASRRKPTMISGGEEDEEWLLTPPAAEMQVTATHHRAVKSNV